MKSWPIVLLLLALGVSPGCQCHPCTRDCTSDLVDCFNDKACVFDHLYHPGLDLTRIGHPDWCASPVNRALCGKGCRCKECCR